jgi:hypothetical protein
MKSVKSLPQQEDGDEVLLWKKRLALRSSLGSPTSSRGGAQPEMVRWRKP